MTDNTMAAGSAPAATQASPTAAASANNTTFAVILSLSFCHLLNDMMQSLILAIYPLLKGNFHLDFAQIGLITLAFQCTASLLQPVVGFSTDRRPMPYSLAVGMGASFSRIGAAVGTWLGPMSLQRVGIGNTMFAAAAVTLVGLLVSVALAPETRHLSLQEAASLKR